MLTRAAVLAILAAGCARGGAIDSDAAPKVTPDAPANAHPDASQPLVDAPVQPHPDGTVSAPGTQLLLTEICGAPNAGEFIEIANPTAAAIDLSRYYLSDNGNYFKLPAGVTVDSTDFLVKFPAGAMLAAGGVATVAIDTAANFQATYGMAPTYSVGAGAAQMTAVSIVGIPSLTNTGELVALFEWDGAADLVKDVDLMVFGAPTVANGIINKSGLTQDGPDSGTTVSTYAADARTIAAQPSAPGSALSTKRIAPETGHETQNGTGNGITGDDETSEDTAFTWDSAAFTAPTPGAIPF